MKSLWVFVRLMNATLVCVALSACGLEWSSTVPTSPTTSLAQASPFSPISLLLVDEESQFHLRARPIHPSLLADLPERNSIPFGHHYAAAVSPDGKTLTVMLWPSGSNNAGGVLHLIDLASWTDTPTDVTLNDSASPMFSPDGHALYWFMPASHDRAHNIPRDYELFRYDLASRQLTTVLRLPTSFTPGATRFVRGGQQLAIVVVPTDANNLTEDVPHVLFVDVASGRITSDVRLNGVKQWQYRERIAGRDGYIIYQAGLAWDLERGVLYVAHADADKLSLIDLAQGKIRAQVEVHPRVSLVEQLLNAFASVAEAKTVPTTSKSAVLSPDGERLYVVGWHAEVTAQADGQWTWRDVPVGLQVIDTSNLTQLKRLDLPIGQLTLSSDGKRLVLATGVQQEFCCQQDGTQRNHLYVLDTHTFETLTHRTSDDAYYLQGFSSDGQYAYFGHTVWRSSASYSVIYQALDLTTNQIATQREITNSFADLLIVGELRRQFR